MKSEETCISCDKPGNLSDDSKFRCFDCYIKWVESGILINSYENDNFSTRLRLIEDIIKDKT